MEETLKQLLLVNQQILEELKGIHADTQTALACLVIDREVEGQPELERVTLALLMDEVLGELQSLSEKSSLGVKLQIVGLRAAQAQGAVVPARAVDAAENLLHIADDNGTPPTPPAEVQTGEPPAESSGT
jgi:hypothetical protein